MKKVAALLLVVVFCGSSAFAGTIRFDPPKQNVEIGGDMTATFDVYIESLDEFSTFTAARLVIGSNDLAVTGFEFDPTFFAFLQSAFADVPGPGQYPSDLDIQIINLFPLPPNVPSHTLPAFVGTLTIDAAGLAERVDPYVVGVDGGFDDRSKAANSNVSSFSEILVGSGMVNVVPEPATLSLLALASLAFIRRRKSA